MMSMSCLEKFANQLAHLSRSLRNSQENPLDEEEDSISRFVFKKYFASHSAIGEEYLWDFFVGYKKDADSLKKSEFVEGGEKIYSPILDKDQISFYVQLYAKGKNAISKAAFFDLLISGYHLSPSFATKAGSNLGRNCDFEGKEWMVAVTKSCFHHKEEMSVCFISNWILINLPRLLIPMHKHYTHQLTSGYITLSNLDDSEAMTKTNYNFQAQEKFLQNVEEGPAENGNGVGNNDVMVKGINPILMWLLSSSLPPVYLNIFNQNQQANYLKRVSSRDLLLQLLKVTPDPHKWTLLYDGADQGMSLNRFQHHVFNYKGPTVMFITCENDYTFLVGIDTEWREHCNFWGGEQCFIIQLKPEFHVIEVGKKSLYANFSIRGYPLGIQAGNDPRNITLDVKSDFEYVYFKQMPCRIINLVVWGCAVPQAKVAQTQQNKWEATESEKRKRVNLNLVDWNDNPDKYLLELAGHYRSYGNR